MNQCREYIEQMYSDAKINQVISKINPVELQDDLKQEFFLILLEYDCDELMKIKTDGNIIGFMLRIIWNLAYSSTSSFYYTYKKNDLKRAQEYLNQFVGRDFSGTGEVAQKVLDKKLQQSAKDAHESIIFQKYSESLNCSEVARYFGIPRKHVNDVVNQCRSELKKIINENT